MHTTASADDAGIQGLLRLCGERGAGSGEYGVDLSASVASLSRREHDCGELSCFGHAMYGASFMAVWQAIPTPDF